MAAPKRVLLIHSFGSAAPPFTTHSTAFETTLTKEMGERVDLDEVSLDVARYATLDIEEAWVDFMGKRQTKWQPDLIVPIGSPAALFVARYRDRLFPAATPIIYAGMDKRRLPSGALERNAGFVAESYHLPGLVEDILQVAPGTTNIAVVIGASPLELFWTEVLKREYQSFTNRVRFTWFNQLSFQQMLECAASLPPNSFLLLILLIRDATGVTHNADEALNALHAVANAPINGMFRQQLGLGIVGGRLYQAEQEGVEAARLAIRVLHGEPVSSFSPKILGTLPPQYDWRELQRWKIHPDRLPPGSIVSFREPTVWQLYSGWIVLGASLLTIQALLISGLLANLRKRRRAEWALVESEARFRIVADEAPVMIWMSDVNKRCNFFNKPWLDFTGRTIERELGDGWAEGIHADDLERCLETYGKAFDRRESFTLEYRLRRNDGEYRWIFDTGRPRYDAQCRFAGYIGSCTDCNERRRADEKFRFAVEAAPSAIVMLNERDEIVLVNSLTERTFGYSREELLGQSVGSLLPERDWASDGILRRQLPAEPEVRAMGKACEWVARRKDGVEFPVEIGLNPIQLEEGKFVLAFIVDISGRRQAEIEMEQQRQQLAHFSRVSTMGELSASIAHELNQPLTAILANAQAAQRFLALDQPDLSEVREIVRDIAGNTNRARHVIQHVRALVRKGVQQFRQLHINDVIHEAAALLRADIMARNGHLELDLRPGLPLVYGDGIQLQQVLVNLTLNAFDAMEDRPSAQRRAVVSTSTESADSLRIWVRDHGVGIPPENLELIFQSFYTTKAKGLGMGLSVTRSIVESHGGRIWAENHVDGGAVFHISLPAVRPGSLGTDAGSS